MQPHRISENSRKCLLLDPLYSRMFVLFNNVRVGYVFGMPNAKVYLTEQI
jgi:hypothetical protein